MHSASSRASKWAVLIAIGAVIIAFGAILWRSISSMGGYPLAFDANKSRTERMMAGAIAPGAGEVSDVVEHVEPVEHEEERLIPGTYTLRFLDASGSHATAPQPVAEHMVLLVHGLDDPGWTWNDVISSLVADGFAVARFDYPNDQAIAKSADLLAEALRELKDLGVERLTLLGHSMGGLVSRDVLTRDAHYGGDGSGGDELPAIERLIMLGTPNAGSQLARLRGLSEIGEQLSRMWHGDRELWRFLEDGEGQAGFDLIPGSEYLTDLNSRPHPEHTEYTIIAGRASPLDSNEIGRWVDRVDRLIPRDDLPRWVRDRIDRIDRDSVKDALGTLVEGAGDGAVAIESTRLAEVADFVLVEADHVSMIVDFLNLEREPPAIAIILDRLRADAEAGSEEAEEERDEDEDAGGTTDGDDDDRG